MTVRTLDPGEFPKLADIEEGFVPNPARTIAIVAEDNGEIVGRMLLMDMVHLEGSWVRPDHRNGSVGYRMFQRVLAEAKRIGITGLMAYTDKTDLDVTNYMERLGFEKQPFWVWSKDI